MPTHSNITDAISLITVLEFEYFTSFLNVLCLGNNPMYEDFLGGTVELRNPKHCSRHPWWYEKVDCWSGQPMYDMYGLHDMLNYTIKQKARKEQGRPQH